MSGNLCFQIIKLYHKKTLNLMKLGCRPFCILQLTALAVGFLAVMVGPQLILKMGEKDIITLQEQILINCRRETGAWEN